MAVSDVISIKGQVMEYPYIPTGVKRNLVGIGMDCDRKGKVVKIVGGIPMVFPLCIQTVFSFCENRELHGWREALR